MYERSAVILERYFAEKFHYKDKNNLKNNYKNYCILIDNLEKYQEVSETEDKIISECEDIAREIKQIQRNQSSLYRKNLKLQEDRNKIFENIDESAEELDKQLDKIERELDKNNERMLPIDQEFVNAIAKFNEKSSIRSESGKNRRRIEKEYRAILEQTENNLNNIDENKISEIKSFMNSNEALSNEDLKTIMLRNGENEKVPFDPNVIENAITFGQNIHRQEVAILMDVYNKTRNLFDDINSNTVKLRKHKKLAKDAKNRLDFISAQKEYLAQFLDNERLSVNLGKQEHKKLMKEACDDFGKDIEQIDRLNQILLEEISGKATQKLYKDLYSAEYLKDLQKKGQDFEDKLSELNMVGKILNPIYWRIESIEKVYTTFDDIVTQGYERDLSKFKIIEIEEEPEEEIEDNFADEDDFIIGAGDILNEVEDDSNYTDEDEDEDDSYIDEFEVGDEEYDDDEYIMDEDDHVEDEYDEDEDDEYEDEFVDEFEDEFEDELEEDDEFELEYQTNYDDEEDDENDVVRFQDDSDKDYEDIEMILGKRKKGIGRGRRADTEKKKSFWKKEIKW